MTDAEPAWADEVLRFWFGELAETDWFGGGAALDARIGERFLLVHEALSANGGEAVQHLHGPRAILAAVLVLDQFTRHLFRRDKRAFASDPIALELARKAVAAGWDRELDPAQRLFLYLPFEHSEHRGDQACAVGLITALGNDGWTLYARKHQELIDRFGRFPHRNEALGRESTAEELEAMKGPMGSF